MLVRRLNTITGSFLVFFTTILLTSCSKDEFKKVFPVSGQVLVDGQPAADCHVYLYRTFDDDHPHRVSPLALTGPDGKFKVTSYITDDGAPDGEYIIGIEWKERSGIMGNNYDGADQLGGAYANKEANKTKPGFVINVGKEPLMLPPFELKMSPEAKKKNDERKAKKAQRPGIGGDK